MVSLSSPSDSDSSDYAPQLENLRNHLQTRFNEPGFIFLVIYSEIGQTPDSSEIFSDTQPSDANNGTRLHYQDYKIDVPPSFPQIDNLFEIFNKNNFNALPEAEKERLSKMLPGGNPEEILTKLFDPDIEYFRCMHPVNLFKSLMESSYFSEQEHHARKIESKMYDLDISHNLYKSHAHLAKWHKFANNLGKAEIQTNPDHYEKMEEIWKDVVPSDPESVRDLPGTAFCPENSSSEDEEPEQDYKASEQSESNDEEQKAAPARKKEKKESKPKVRDELDELLAGDRFQELKMHKNQLTIKPRSKEWINWYRKQEIARYNNPTRPWIYYNEDGTMSIVAPICKRPMTSSSKPREHIVLKNERPACITILCLARDAASRLPDGIGTRADICDMIKDSQYIVEDISEPNISNIVSGALDRLHYEKDPCVRYDTERKIWIYLHRTRTLDYPQWAETNTGIPNSLEVCSFNPFKAMENEHKSEPEKKEQKFGDGIVVIKLDEKQTGKRPEPEKQEGLVKTEEMRVKQENTESENAGLKKQKITL